jgi:hypothetical protein
MIGKCPVIIFIVISELVLLAEYINKYGNLKLPLLFLPVSLCKHIESSWRKLSTDRTRTISKILPRNYSEIKSWKCSFVFTILESKGKSHCRIAELYLSFAACTVPRFSFVWTRQVSRDVSANAGILYDESGVLRDTINGTLGTICG